MKQLSKNQIKMSVEVIKILDKMWSSIHMKRVTLISFLFLFNISVITPGSVSISDSPIIQDRTESKEKLYIEAVKLKMENSLILEVERYFNEVAPETKLSANCIVEKCLEYNTDIIFVLAQGLLESHFGTKGKAVNSNSVWNVGTYDNGQVLYTYKTPNESIEPYLKLINERYLINITSKGDTIYKDVSHLTSDKGYVNDSGDRFASARGYENAMRKLMISIDAKTSIKLYQGILMLPDETFLSYFNPNQIEPNSENYLAYR